ncbi:MAG: hypothetical protein CMJ81_20035 [Planctomycetaceae bacterium]|nr:hypothetical protein [Planctomycetaceae bacterium]MBP63243.1 hypothetical protein [Planctomycetaceae bacterium]
MGARDGVYVNPASFVGPASPSSFLRGMAGAVLLDPPKSESVNVELSPPCVPVDRPRMAKIRAHIFKTARN